MRRSAPLLAIAAILMAASTLGARSTPAQEWTRFRGPNGSGESEANSIPLTWTTKDCRWRVELPGVGHSSPVVWGERVFVTSSVESDGTRIIRCLKTSDGDVLWTEKFPGSTYKKNGLNAYAAATPVVDQDRLYSTWVAPDSYLALALDQASGKELWRRDLGSFAADHGFGASPILWGEFLIVPNDQDGKSFVAALDRTTGEVRWKADRRTLKAAYSTPIVYQPEGGQPQLILSSWAHGISSLDPRNGKTNWELPLFQNRVVGSPTMAAELIIAACGEAGGGKRVVAVRPGEPEKGVEARMAYEFRGSLPYVPVPVACGNLVFLWSDSGVVTCADAPTGKVHWRERVGGKFFASPVRVRDRIYCPSREGEMVVLAAAETYKLLRRFSLEETTCSTPAVAAGVMYVRTLTHLMAVGGR